MWRLVERAPIQIATYGADSDGEEWTPPQVPQEIQTALYLAGLGGSAFVTGLSAPADVLVGGSYCDGFF